MQCLQCCFWALMALCINLVLNCNVCLPCTIRGRGVRAIMVYCNSVFYHWVECGLKLVYR